MPPPALAQPPLTLTAAQGEYPLGLHLEILEDPTTRLTLADVTAPPYNALFEPSREQTPNFGYIRSALWVRVRLQVNCATCAGWLLEISDPTLDSVDLYLLAPGAEAPLLTRRSGDLQPLASRDMNHHNFVFSLPLETGQSYTLYLRIWNRGSTPLPVTLWSLGAFTRHHTTAHFGFGFYYGFIFIMIGYNLFLFFFLRDRAYFYYVLFIASMGLFQLTLDGFARQYLWPGAIWWGDVAILFFIGFTVLAGLNFGTSFLETNVYAPRLDKILNLMKLAALLLIGLGLWPPLYRFVAPTMSTFVAVASTLGISAGVISWRQGYRAARYYLLAWSGVMAGALLIVFNYFTVLAVSFFTEHGLRIGGFLLILFLALALADRINLLKAETEQANNRLQENEQRLSQFLEAMPTGVAVIDGGGRLTYVNQRAREIFKAAPRDNRAHMTLNELVSRFLLRVSGTEDSYPPEQLPPSRALRGEYAVADDVEVVHSDGQTPLEIWASPIFDERETIVYAIAAFQDITERRQTETELTAYRQQLEELVAQRTDDLARVNRQLQEDIQARKQTEAALQTALVEAESLRQVATILNSSLDSQAIINKILEQLHRVIAYDSAGLFLRDGEALLLTDGVEFKKSILGWRIPLTSANLVTRPFRKRDVVIIADAQTEPGWRDDWPGDDENSAKIRSWMGVPLLTGERGIGVLTVDSFKPQTYSREDGRLFQTFASQAAIALENARLFAQSQAANRRMQEELSLARDIQQSLLLPPRPGWTTPDVICYSAPAYEVGGDFYHYHRFQTAEQGERYGFTVGDVSGKGVSAALLMAVSLSQFNTILDQPLSPPERVAYLDNALTPYTKPRRQNCAMCYVELTLPTAAGSGRLQIANAGCIPPFIRRAGGAVEFPELGGFALGQGLGVEYGYRPASLEIFPGDTIILTSDGVAEAVNPAGQMLGFEQLARLIEKAPADRAEAALKYLTRQIFSFIGRADQQDDLTLVVIRVKTMKSQ